MSKNFDSPIEVGFCRAAPEPANAAESLPAKPEQETTVAGVLSHEEHRRACMFNLPAYVFGSSPKVAPVEAKEKERLCTICDSPVCYLSANGKYYCSMCKPSWQEEELDVVAEPKPTPSTPCIHQWKHRQFDFCALCGDPKPQPDSSSTPSKPRFYCFDRSAGVSTCETQCNNCWAKGESMEPDSSSISTEQTFNEWFKANHKLLSKEKERQDRENFYNASRAVYIFAQAAWNAAKGSTETEGK